MIRRNAADDYHLYELGADGSDLTQLTFGAGLSDIDPIYLPDGRILFTSTREPKYCMCNRHIMGNLFRMDADGAPRPPAGAANLVAMTRLPDPAMTPPAAAMLVLAKIWEIAVASAAVPSAS